MRRRSELNDIASLDDFLNRTDSSDEEEGKVRSSASKPNFRNTAASSVAQSGNVLHLDRLNTLRAKAKQEANQRIDSSLKANEQNSTTIQSSPDGNASYLYGTAKTAITVFDPSKTIRNYGDTGTFSMRISDESDYIPNGGSHLIDDIGKHDSMEEFSDFENDFSPTASEEKDEIPYNSTTGVFSNISSLSVSDIVEPERQPKLVSKRAEYRLETRNAASDHITNEELEEFALSQGKKLVDKEQLSQLTTENVTMSTQIIQLENMAEKRKNEADSLFEEVQKLRDENASFREQVSSINEKLLHASQEIDRLRTELKKEQQAHRVDLEKYEQRILEIQQEKMSQEELEIKSSSLLSDIKMDFEKRIEKLRGEKHDLENTANDSIRKEAESRKQLILLQAEKESLSAQVSGLQEENKHLADKLREVRGVGIRERLQSGDIDSEELVKLKKDIIDQEKILQATQEDNKRLINQLKATEKELREVKERNVTKGNFQTTVVESSVDKQDLTHMRERIHDLELKLHHQTQSALDTEKELKEHIQKLKWDKKILEEELTGVTQAKSKDYQQNLERLEQLFTTTRKEHEALVRELQEKIKRLVENQEIVAKDDQTIHEQRKVIHHLNSRITELEEEKKKRIEEVKRTQRNPADARRIRELEKLVDDLKRKQYDPNSISELIKAVKPSKEENEELNAIQRKCESLQKLLDEAETKINEDTEKHERAKEQYQTKISILEEELSKLKKKYLHPIKSSSREKELETQLEETRNTYQKKLRNLEAKLQREQSQAKRNGSHAITHQEAEKYLQKIRDLESEVRNKEDQIQKLTKEAITLDAGTNNDAPTSGDTSSKQKSIDEKELSDLRKENERLRIQVEALQDNYSQWMKNGINQNNCHQEVLILKREIEEYKIKLEMSNLGKETALDNAREMVRNDILAMRQQYEKQIEFYQDLVEQSERKFLEQMEMEQRRSTQAIKDALKIGEDNIIDEHHIGEQDEEELERSRRARKLRFLLGRLEDLECKYKLKEMEFSRTLTEEKYKHDVELRLAKQQFEMILHEKNREVQKFKASLENIRAGLMEMKSGANRKRQDVVGPNLAPPQPQPQPEKLFTTRHR